MALTIRALFLCLLLTMPATAANQWADPATPGRVYDQGDSGLCTLFAFAHWAQIMTPLLDAPETMLSDVYRQEFLRIRGTNAGPALSLPQVFALARRAGIIPPQAACVRAYSLNALALSPLIARYRTDANWLAPGPDGRIADDFTQPVHGFHDVLLTGQDEDGTLWLKNSSGAGWGTNGFARISPERHQRTIVEMWHVVMPGAPRSADEAQAMVLASRIGLHVRALRKALVALGFDIPCDSQQVMLHVIARSMEGQLTPKQEQAKADAAMLYIILQKPSPEMPGGVTDEMIAAVWAVIKQQRGIR